MKASTELHGYLNTDHLLSTYGPPTPLSPSASATALATLEAQHRLRLEEGQAQIQHSCGAIRTHLDQVFSLDRTLARSLQ